MYIYFLPLSHSFSGPALPEASDGIPGSETKKAEMKIPLPTSDGGIEHTSARFLPAADWLKLADQREIVLFPPQYLLLHLLMQFLSPLAAEEGAVDEDALLGELQKQRDRVMEFVYSGDPPWTVKCICPKAKNIGQGQVVLEMDEPGPELAGTKRRGEEEMVLTLKFEQGVPRDIRVRLRHDVFPLNKGAAQRL